MIYIGTSGWAYPHWKKGVFYPKDWKDHELKYYQKFFNSVELNASFYHLPKKKTFSNWRNLVPKDFIFSVKGARYISHVLRLSEPREPLKNLLENASELKEKLGPIFFQFSPSFKARSKKLADFIALLPKEQRFAFEFRHESWFDPEIYEILKEKNLALIFSDTPKYPYVEEETADFIYLRLHGHEILYSSSYNQKQLEEYAQKITKWHQNKKDVYCYFDNDAHGFAPQNAIELKKILNSSKLTTGSNRN